MNSFYNTIGITKQAVYQYDKRQELFNSNLSQLVLEADDLRKAHPGCGVEKMYDILKPEFIGRDRFVETFMSLGYRLKRHKNYRKTTISSKLYYPNLIKGKRINGPSQIWQSDITYIKVNEKHYYAVFIIDVYTRKIVGYKVSDNMRATANLNALKMALKNNNAPLIHHSDRGSQYTYKTYIELLLQNGSKISMGGSAQDNAYVERFNRTIKEEYLKYWNPQSFSQLKICVKKAVDNYNNIRTHNNIRKFSPVNYERKCLYQNRDINQILTIFNNESINKPVNSI